jgi:glycogen debranching enzyme
VAMPRTRPGIMVPYQEHPQTYPLELKLSFDPKRDAGMVFPLIMAITDGAPLELAQKLLQVVPEAYAQTKQYYSQFRRETLTIETPDEKLNKALRWAEVAIDQTQVKHGDETGLVAGYYESADSARPGYAWFFGRDTLWTTYAINSYGDFALTRRALDFLIRRQRADGKIMHEYSQTAEFVDWKQTPYFYASADATPLLVMAMRDYVRTSGDVAYLKANWAAIKKAYEFTRNHEGGDGIYDNSEGPGWVESWPPGMPQEEVYLAAIDQQSATAMSYLAGLAGEQEVVTATQNKAGQIKAKIEAEFYDQGDDFYAFSRNANGSLDHTASVYSSVAWWDGTLALGKAGSMLTRWASPEFSTDWGTRDISERTTFYDPISYHQGSIWPLFTGWVSLAEYRAGRPLSAYSHLMQNVNLTWAQDLGAVTELLSGQFFEPLGRSSSHQMWSSAMVITPLIRGLFGVDYDALNHGLRMNPHIPAEWDHAALRRVRLGNDLFDLEYRRSGTDLTIRAVSDHPTKVCLLPSAARAEPCGGEGTTTHTLSVPLPPVEIALPVFLPPAGSVTSQLKVESEEVGDRRATFTFSSPAGRTYDLKLRRNRTRIVVKGADIENEKLHLSFGAANGYTRKLVTFTW